MARKNIAAIPEVIHDFNMYLSGNRLAGITGDVALPSLEGTTEEISGVGILGSYESVVPGIYKSMEQEIPFRCLNEDYFNLVDPTQPLELTLRGAIQTKVKATGAVDYTGLRVVLRGIPKKMELGTVKQAGPMDSKISLEATYILVEHDGFKKLELDKINGIFIVNGKDVLQKVHKLT